MNVIETNPLYRIGSAYFPSRPQGQDTPVLGFPCAFSYNVLWQADYTFGCPNLSEPAT